VYLNNNTTARLYAISGFNMSVYANQASGNGGALYANNGGYFDVYGQVSLDRNRADNGGAIYLSNGSRVWIDDYFQIKPELWDNRADNGSGGAIYASNSPSVQCDGAVFGHEDEGNLASAGDGGAIYLSGSTLDADNCLFAENQATNNGGAIAAYTSTVALRASLTSGALVTSEPASHDGLAPLAPAATACNPMLGLCSAFFENVADSDGNSIGDGGAIYNDDGTFTLKHTALYTNTAYRGGAIYQTGTSANAQVENTLIYSNTVGIALGAGIRTAGGTFSVTHTTIANNINGAGYSQLNTTSEVHNSIAWGNEANGFLGTFVATSCNIDQSGNAGPAVDPQFSNPGTGENYHLLGGSPAINACSTGLSPDLDGVPRPVGSNYDMGAFEYASGIDFTPDNSSNGVPASAVHYVHTLTNSGNRFDTFTMVASSSQGWVVTIEPAPSVMLTAGQSTTVTVTVNIPGGAAVGTVDTTMVSAAPSADPSLTATVTDTTTVIAAPDIDVTPLTLSVTLVPGETAMRTLTIQNNGSATLIWSLAENPASAWLNVNPVSGNIPGAGNVSVNVSFDTTGLAGGVYTTMLQITSNDPDEPQIDVFVTLIVQNYIYLPLVMR